ncbi:MAG: hypothetical protein KatS3mg083_288 [Candidatus Dojkabacteria bacterium]|nr:MAG: hypothetical protein KatS3mg083_288 [Candidatus Dojkabacteria bacterium]
MAKQKGKKTYILSFEKEIEPLGSLYEEIKYVRKEAFNLMKHMLNNYTLDNLQFFIETFEKNLYYRFNDERLQFKVFVIQQTDGSFRLIVKVTFNYEITDNLITAIVVPDAVDTKLPISYFIYNFSAN